MALAARPALSWGRLLGHLVSTAGRGPVRAPHNNVPLVKLNGSRSGRKMACL